jgi:cell division protein FtsB
MIASKLKSFLVICLLLPLFVSEAAGQSTNSTNINLKEPVSETNSKDGSVEKQSYEAKLNQNDRTIFWLSLVCALAFMIPLPLCIYHFRRIASLLAEIEGLKVKISSENALKTRIEELSTNNSKIELELQQLQEKHRLSLKTAQEKYEGAIDTIEKVKKELQKVELENKKLSGVLLLKQQEKRG